MITVNFDGSCWPNPKGRASGAYHITQDDNVLASQGFYIGRGRGMSSNCSEYAAYIEALRFLKVNDLMFEKILVRGDSKLVINQMSGKWRIKKGIYKDKAEHALSFTKDFPDISFEWISRELNTICDALAENALRG